MAWLESITIMQQGWLAKVKSIDEVMDHFDLDQDIDINNE